MAVTASTGTSVSRRSASCAEPLALLRRHSPQWRPGLPHSGRTSRRRGPSRSFHRFYALRARPEHGQPARSAKQYPPRRQLLGCGSAFPASASMPSRWSSSRNRGPTAAPPTCTSEYLPGRSREARCNRAPPTRFCSARRMSSRGRRPLLRRRRPGSTADVQLLGTNAASLTPRFATADDSARLASALSATRKHRAAVALQWAHFLAQPRRDIDLGHDWNPQPA